MTTYATRAALMALGLATLAGPALAQSATVYVRPGYGFTGALEQTERQTGASPYAPSPYGMERYTYVPQGYVYTAPGYAAPVTTYTYPPPGYTPPPAATVATAPILDRDTIEDRLDDQGYDDIKVGELQGTAYMARAKDRDDRKVWLRVDATSGYVLESGYRR